MLTPAPYQGRASERLYQHAQHKRTADIRTQKQYAAEAAAREEQEVAKATFRPSLPRSRKHNQLAAAGRMKRQMRADRISGDLGGDSSANGSPSSRAGSVSEQRPQVRGSANSCIHENVQSNHTTPQGGFDVCARVFYVRGNLFHDCPRRLQPRLHQPLTTLIMMVCTCLAHESSFSYAYVPIPPPFAYTVTSSAEDTISLTATPTCGKRSLNRHGASVKVSAACSQ